ncbi:hypothetical protein AKJ57_06690 [candidate division MSBL1 archaeon SCGC-AAA259A05]|uniref:HicB-like antitoxin of toxin-antitoxin system domain-containing protein n=1 Tax=candidate division MSBL1 archaeon SCGC-AAA259A05 TaxID=1698259 RepID=A0A133U307_9EURY|nr:hypothetical protein AKJ57_06690 [candidate division MSBL1 archaeon SCGC-AAA259A05]
MFRVPSETSEEEVPSVESPHTVWKEENWWVAKDSQTGVASQGKTRREALENLDEAVALHKEEIGEPIDSWEKERKLLEELGIDPEEVEKAREEKKEFLEFMQPDPED